MRGRTFVCLGNDLPRERDVMVRAPREPEVVRRLLLTGCDIHNIGLDTNMLSSARKPSALRQEDPEGRRTIRPGNCSELVVWRMWLVRRRIDPIGTGFAKEMPSRETKRTWHPVKSSAFANPSCVD